MRLADCIGVVPSDCIGVVPSDCIGVVPSDCIGVVPSDLMDFSDLLEGLVAGISLTAIGDLNDDTLGLVLQEAREYKPALALVCQRWASAVARAKIPKDAVLCASKLAARGHGELLHWLRVVWPYYDVKLRKLLSKAAVGGHSKLCSALMAEWDVPEPAKIRYLVKGAAIRGDMQQFRAALDWLHASSGDRKHRKSRVHAVFRWAARGGRADICEQIVSSLFPAGLLNVLDAGIYASMLKSAATYGHEEICLLALEWGAGNLTTRCMLKAAVEYDAEHGGTRMCEIAREGEGVSERVDLMLEYAANVGCSRLCQKMFEWGSTELGMMLSGAARGHHPDLCREAKALLDSKVDSREVDPADVDEFLSDSLILAVTRNREMSADQEAVCRLLVEWGVPVETLFDEAIGAANARLAWLAVELCAGDETSLESFREIASDDDYDFGKFILEHPGGSYDDLLFYEVKRRNRTRDGYELCEQALVNGARCVDWLLCKGAHIGDEELCRLAVRYGARDFNGMLMAACAGFCPFLAELARKWGAAAAQRPVTDLRRVRSE
jgi:hypothetical protein